MQVQKLIESIEDNYSTRTGEYLYVYTSESDKTNLAVIRLVFVLSEEEVRTAIKVLSELYPMFKFTAREPVNCFLLVTLA